MVSIPCADRQHIAKVDTLVFDVSILERAPANTQNDLSKLISSCRGLWRGDTKALFQDTNKVCGSATVPKELRVFLSKTSVIQ